MIRCADKPAKLETGVWKASLQRADGHKVVFNFELTDSAGKKTIYVFNANERMRVDSITLRNDSVFIQMPFFDSRFEAKINKDGSLQGKWIKNYGSRLAEMPFHAVPDDSTRLTAYKQATKQITGSWDIVFADKKTNAYKAIGLFDQQGSKVTGTIMTAAGDYRYLQGVVSGDTMKISGFDGCHALLFTAIVKDTATLSEGKLYSINSKAKMWHAQKKSYDSLPAAYSVNNIRPGTAKLHFSLKDIRTLKNVSLQDSFFHNKVAVIQLLGSWCPNCMDETAYLSQYYNKNSQKDIAIVGVAFERTADFERSKQVLQPFFNHFNIQYPVLFSGVSASDPDLTQKVFPALPQDVTIFPTTIFLDKEGYVRKIHQGFNGPATGKYYTEFKDEFNNIVNSLLAEK